MNTPPPAVARPALLSRIREALYVVYPGHHRFALDTGIEAVPLAALYRDDSPASPDA